jgi:hypothetical protein
MGRCQRHRPWPASGIWVSGAAPAAHQRTRGARRQTAALRPAAVWRDGRARYVCPASGGLYPKAFDCLRRSVRSAAAYRRSLHSLTAARPGTSHLRLRHPVLRGRLRLTRPACPYVRRALTTVNGARLVGRWRGPAYPDAGRRPRSMPLASPDPGFRPRPGPADVVAEAGAAPPRTHSGRGLFGRPAVFCAWGGLAARLWQPWPR